MDKEINDDAHGLTLSRDDIYIFVKKKKKKKRKEGKSSSPALRIV